MHEQIQTNEGKRQPTKALSLRIYGGLVVVLAVLSAVAVFLPQGDHFAEPIELPAPKHILALANVATMLLLYGGLGLVGIRLARKVGFVAIWDPDVTNRQRFGTPLIGGTVIGVLFILVDIGLSRLHGLGPLPHPPFPTSVVATVTAAIGEEILFRVFLIPFIVWLLLLVRSATRGSEGVFWFAATVSALAFSALHIPSLMLLLGVDGATEMPVSLIAEILILNGSLSLLAAHYLRTYGLLAAIGLHFWVDVVWHVMWGPIMGY